MRGHVSVGSVQACDGIAVVISHYRNFRAARRLQSMNARVSTAYEEGEKKRGKARNRGCVSEHPESTKRGSDRDHKKG